MTVLEIMIVLAIIGGMFFIAYSGFRYVTKADLVENSTELTAIMRRASQLAIEHGEVHRVVLDFDRDPADDKRFDYAVEVCHGPALIVRNEAVRNDEEETKRKLDQGKQRLNGLPPDALSSGDAEEATHRATALAGHHVADRICTPATDNLSGDANGKAWLRRIRKSNGIKFKEVWVQHRDESVTKGQVAIYFFPQGQAEKAVIELTDGSEVFSVIVSGLTGRVELHDGAPKDVSDVMLKNVMGDRNAKREDQP
jgi:general secretion pathway protein H